MEIIANILSWITTNIFSETSFIIGIMVIVGLIFSKKSVSQIIQGFLKTIIGYQMMMMGTTAFIGVINNLGVLVSVVFDTPAITMETNFMTNYGQYYGPVLGLGFILHLIFERFLVPKKHRFVFMGGGHFLLRVSMLTTGIAVIVYGQSNVLAVVAFGTIISAIWYCIQPAYIHRFTKELRGDDMAGYGHHSSIAVLVTCLLSKAFGKKENSTEDINFPKGLSFLKDMSTTICLTQFILLFIFGILCGGSTVQEIAGINTNPWIWCLLQGTIFSGGFMALAFGLRTMMNELIPAFSGISEKIIPGARPALDVPTVFPFGTNAVMVGSTCTVAIYIVYMIIFPLVGLPRISLILASLFMSGAGVAVFGNKMGGIRGALIGSFVTATMFAFGFALIQVLGGSFYSFEFWANMGTEPDDLLILYPIVVGLGRLLFGERAIPFGPM